MSFLNKIFHRKKAAQPIPEPPPSKLIDKISNWMVKGMIDCCFYNDFSSIGTGSPEEIQAAFGNLISQYHDACKSEHMKQYVRLSASIKTIEFQWQTVNLIAEILKERFCESAAKYLRELYPLYPFTQETFEHDLGMVGKGEIANQIKYERLNTELEKLEKGLKKDEHLNTQQKHENFINRLFEINKYEGVKYDINTMSVLELAIAENRLSKYIEDLNDQIKKNGSVN
ncbi:MAG: hypothetical protein K0Q79_2742 [Flavipsychrobacter sp.]|jgi:ribosomal protein L22|nr:hypothetical protein [Flavipsychrobacter sp.]